MKPNRFVFLHCESIPPKLQKVHKDIVKVFHMNKSIQHMWIKVWVSLFLIKWRCFLIRLGLNWLVHRNYFGNLFMNFLKQQKQKSLCFISSFVLMVLMAESFAKRIILGWIITLSPCYIIYLVLVVLFYFVNPSVKCILIIYWLFVPPMIS